MSASAHILTEHTGGGWGQKWRHTFYFKSLKMSFLHRATKERTPLDCCLAGRASRLLYLWRICWSSVRIGWFPVGVFFWCVCFFTPSQPLTASFISSSFPSFHSLPFWLDRPVLDLRSTDWSELYMFVTCNEPFSDQQWTCVCSPG